MSRALFEFTTGRGYAVPADVEIDESAPKMIRHVRLWKPWRYFRSRTEIVEAVSDLGQATAAYAAAVTDHGLEPWLTLRSSAVMSVASLEKLYLLIGLADDVASGPRSWSDTVALRSEDRSWPYSSGVMHGWPSGTGLSLQAVAALMIAESDNTAADLVLRLLGRDRMVAILKACGHSEPSRNVPFLSTAEVWKLKYHWNGRLGRTYLGLNEAGRKAYLDADIAALGSERIQGPPELKPTLLDGIGWFASAEDIALVLLRLWRLSSAHQEAPPLALCGINGTQTFASGFVDYVGVKSGTDAGIRTVAYIARLGTAWHVVVCLVNDARREPPDEEFWAVANGLLAAAGRELGE